MFSWAACLLLPRSANVSGPSQTPAFLAAGLADGGSGDADTVNHCPTRSAADGDLRDDGIRLRKRRERHCLRRCCDGSGEASSSNQPDHSSPPFTKVTKAVGDLLGVPPHSIKLSARCETHLDFCQRIESRRAFPCGTFRVLPNPHSFEALSVCAELS